MARIVLNGGSSSWKCGVYDVAADASALDPAEPLVEIRLSWEGDDDAARVTTRDRDGRERTSHERLARDAAATFVLDALSREGFPPEGAEAIGHRIVHGADRFTRTTRITDDVVEGLRELAPLAPTHNPVELAAIAAVGARVPAVPQYAVFDTQFHTTMPPTATHLPVPRAWSERGIRRYGFHGSSVAYAAERVLGALGRAADAPSGLVVAHLGGGCSVTAVRDGASAWTSMGFTPLDGTMMATRSGAVDPSALVYLLRADLDAGRDPRASLDALDRGLEHEAGLLGVSGVASDIRAVRAAAESGDARARLALDVYAVRLAETIATALVHLPRLDALVFTGGVGEHDAALRRRVAELVSFARLTIDDERNATASADATISPDGVAPRVDVVTAREEWYISREGARL